MMDRDFGKHTRNIWLCVAVRCLTSLLRAREKITECGANNITERSIAQHNLVAINHFTHVFGCLDGERGQDM